LKTGKTGKRPKNSLAIELNRLDNGLSPRQRKIMVEFWDSGHGHTMPLDIAITSFQNTLDSLCKRGYLELTRRGVVCTKRGWYVRDHWEEATPYKDHASQRFGSYIMNTFASIAGSYTPPPVEQTPPATARANRRGNVHVMRKSA
jgi:hypothetical protein